MYLNYRSCTHAMTRIYKNLCLKYVQTLYQYSYLVAQVLQMENIYVDFFPAKLLNHRTIL